MRSTTYSRAIGNGKPAIPKDSTRGRDTCAKWHAGRRLKPFPTGKSPLIPWVFFWLCKSSFWQEWTHNIFCLPLGETGQGQTCGASAYFIYFALNAKQWIWLSENSWKLQCRVLPFQHLPGWPKYLTAKNTATPIPYAFPRDLFELFGGRLRGWQGGIGTSLLAGWGCWWEYHGRANARMTNGVSLRRFPHQ